MKEVFEELGMLSWDKGSWVRVFDKCILYTR